VAVFPYSLLHGVAVVYIFTWRVCVVEWCRVSVWLGPGEVAGGAGV
jgi:hypothetical protein